MPRKQRLTLTTTMQWRKRITITPEARTYLMTLGKDKPIGTKHDFYLGHARAKNDWHSHDKAMLEWERIKTAIDQYKKTTYQTKGTILVEYNPPKPIDINDSSNKNVKYVIHDGKQFVLNSVVSEAKMFHGETSEPETYLDDFPPKTQEAKLTINESVIQYQLTKKGTHNITQGRGDNISYALTYLTKHIKGMKGIENLSAQDWRKVSLALSNDIKNGNLAPSTAKQYQSDIRQFIRWAWGESLCELPRNLTSREYTIILDEPQVETFTTDEIKRTLQAADESNKLYYLLMLNCGFYAIDISSLTKEQIDWQQGTITHRRIKRQKGDKGKAIPTVTYRLWDETLALLHKCKSRHKTLLLTNRNGLPLVKDTKEERTREDAIGKAWQRTFKHKAKVAKPIKLLRHTASSAIATKYGDDVASYFLGHAPNSTAARHYIKRPANYLDDAIRHIHQSLGIADAMQAPPKESKPKKPKKSIAK